MKIDIVYTWVDGSDPLWLNRRIEKTQLLGNVLSESKSEARFMDNDELKFSLRSIFNYAPWVNKIFIVTDNQVPNWLQTSHPKIQIIDHKEIFSDTSILPTYSARGIETQIHHIKDLSEHFIYFNDDMFLGNICTPDQFFTNKGLNRVFVSEIFPIPSNKAFDISQRPAEKRNDHQFAIVNTRKLIRQKFNKSIYYNIRHGAKPLIKSILYDLENLFTEEITRTSRNSFRTEEDVLMLHLFEYYSLIKGYGKPKYLKTVSSKKKTNANISLFNNKYTFGYINLHEKGIEQQLKNIKANKPFMLCLNQTPKTPPENIEKIKNFLKDYFPEKSPFEK
ncbi:MAG: hypothetical protein CVV23_03270 [Ignavibacteriae bacterium HGW-Ignavibacteriae-2]|nr:MAG: hypothetical protein CVV23_03270 [Ignavibacteriae bacterium HGW-Ignavibacteriae-2]